MPTVHAGSRRSSRPGLFALLVLVAGCAGKPTTGSIQVLVTLEPGLVSRCVKVTARDGVNERETKAIPLAGKMSPLKIGMQEDGLVSPVTVQAFGYLDEGCTMLSPDEKSAEKEASYATPTTVVNLTLAPASNGDGGRDAGDDAGVDAGVDDAGTDAGADAGSDGGADGGIDVDHDGYSPPDDCDDNNAAVHPNVDERTLCGNGLDDDCNGFTDCSDAVCTGRSCGTTGTCLNNMCTQEICADGIDNNGNGAIDCLDPDCAVGASCTDSNACTTGDRCIANGVCQKTGDVTCNTPPRAQCYSATGMCMPDAGASCVYTLTLDAGCDDTLACTVNDSCATGTCAGTAKSCTQSANTCLALTGSCAEPTGDCSFTPVQAGSGSCSDGNNCTTGDACDGDGGCKGNLVTCTPNQCQTANGCSGAGACMFGNKNGQACDAGTATPGTCDVSFNCNAAPPSLFPYVPSNFIESDLPTDGGFALSIGMNRTLNTDSTPTLSGTTMPPFRLVTPPGGVQSVLVNLTSLAVTGTNVLTITGARPLIIAVVGNVSIDGKIVARNGGSSAGCGNGGNGGSGSGNGLGGGGGGGFGSAGGLGGVNSGTAGTAGNANGEPTLIPLRGGCKGGNSAAANGGGAGGALQISASGSFNLNGFIAAPGGGGRAGTNNQEGGGGGGSGGGILIEASTLTFTGNARLTANGGSGGEGAAGNGTNGANGLEGNDSSTTATANGGDSSSGGAGGVGAAGTTAAGPGIGGNGGNDGSGGAGGGVGIIRVNALTCMRNGTPQVFSPAFTGTACP